MSFHKLLPALPLLLSSFASAQQNQVFTVNCQPLTVQRADPIVFPGQISPHVHTVTGGTNFRRTESNQVAINALNTTCDKTLDHSNYWQPQLYYHNRNGTFSMVHMQGNVSRHSSCMDV